MNIAGKTPWLTLHVTSPLQSETPLALLRETRITDKSRLYVRNNQDLAGSMTLATCTDAWTLNFCGAGGQTELTLAELRQRPQQQTEMVLQCSGNSRGRFGGTHPVSGAQWQDGAVANVVFGGVLLSDLLSSDLLSSDLLSNDLVTPELRRGATFLTAQGAGTAHEDDLPAFTRSVPLDEVLDSALLALDLNGEPLPAIHGGPVRLVLPGFYGVNNVKWLTHLSFDKAPTDNHYQRDKYRLPKERLEPGAAFEATLDNSVPSWRMKLRSLLWQPLVGETLRAGPVELGGVAWSDGRSRVSRVAVSCDGGVSWHDAALDVPESPYAWTPWSLTLPLTAGEPELWIRAFDDAGHAQPLDPNDGWNPAGYEWHSAERVRLAVR